MQRGTIFTTAAAKADRRFAVSINDPTIRVNTATGIYHFRGNEVVRQHNKRGVCLPKGSQSGGISFTGFLSLLLGGALNQTLFSFFFKAPIAARGC